MRSLKGTCLVSASQRTVSPSRTSCFPPIPGSLVPLAHMNKEEKLNKNPHAKALAGKLYRQRIVKSAKRYKRKAKHKGKPE